MTDDKLTALAHARNAFQASDYTSMWHIGDAVPTTLIVSPFAGDTRANVAMMRLACRDCLERGEVPLAGHGLYTQPGVLDDADAEERALGQVAGLLAARNVDKIAVYRWASTPVALSAGMIRDLQALFMQPEKYVSPLSRKEGCRLHFREVEWTEQEAFPPTPLSAFPHQPAEPSIVHRYPSGESAARALSSALDMTDLDEDTKLAVMTHAETLTRNWIGWLRTAVIEEHNASVDGNDG